MGAPLQSTAKAFFGVKMTHCSPWLNIPVAFVSPQPFQLFMPTRQWSVVFNLRPRGTWAGGARAGGVCKVVVGCPVLSTPVVQVCSQQNWSLPAIISVTLSPVLCLACFCYFVTLLFISLLLPLQKHPGGLIPELLHWLNFSPGVCP